jgi:hypothetical protein
VPPEIRPPRLGPLLLLLCQEVNISNEKIPKANAGKKDFWTDESFFLMITSDELWTRQFFLGFISRLGLARSLAFRACEQA